MPNLPSQYRVFLSFIILFILVLLPIIKIVSFDNSLILYYFGVISAWGVVHILIVRGKKSAKGKSNVYEIVLIIIKVMIAFTVLLTIIFLWMHPSIQQTYSEEGLDDNDTKIIFFKDWFIRLYSLPLIVICFWLLLKIYNNKYTELMMVYIADSQREIQHAFSQFAINPTPVQLEKILSQTLDICKFIPILSLGKIFNYKLFPSEQPVLSCWLFTPNYKNSYFDIKAVAGPNDFINEFRKIKDDFKVYFYNKGEYNKLCNLKKGGKISSDEFESKKEKVISACGFIFEEEICKSYPDLDNCDAFTHKYLEYVPPQKKSIIKFKSLLGLPIEYQGKKVGVLMILSSRLKYNFTEFESIAIREISYGLGNVIGMASLKDLYSKETILGSR